MALKTEVKVGLVVVAAILILIAVYWFLGGLRLGASSYKIYALFTNAQKLEKGSDVRMAGVKIGLISSVKLTKNNQARVNMMIWNDNKIPANSVARITTGSFIGEYYVEIVPGTQREHLKDGQRIAVTEPVQFDQLIADAGSLLAELKVSAAGINQLLGDKEVIASFKATAISMKNATQSASELINSAKGMLSGANEHVQVVFANLERATNNAAGVTAQLQDMLANDARPNVKAIMGQVETAANNLNKSILQAQDLIGSFKQSAGQVSATLGKVNGVADQAQQMMTNLNTTSASIKNMATDPELQANLKATVRNAAEASEQAKELMAKVNRKLGGRSTPITLPPPGSTTTAPGAVTSPRASAGSTYSTSDTAAAAYDTPGFVPLLGISGDGLWDTGTGNYRFDANYTLAGSDNSFYRIGGFDIGEGNKFNLQYGKSLGKKSAARAGMYASRIGVGFDYMPMPKLLLSSDLFRPNEPELELRGIYNVRDGLGLYAGVADVLHENNRNLLLGVQYMSW